MTMIEIAWSPDIASVPMNERQRRIVDLIQQRFLLRQHGEAHAESYEFKRFEVSAWAGERVALAVESGRKGDAGTMASVFCRRSFFVVIGPRGGVEVHDSKRRHKHALWMVAGP